jgi:hypothetical protein
MMRKKTKMAWSVALSAAMVEVMEERKVRVEALQQVLQRQNLLPVTRQIPVTAQPIRLQR